LWLYGRLKGVPRSALKRDIEVLLAVSGLTAKTDELAPALSGGNQRKLSLMIALIGDRPVILIDEFSSGVDPFSKREAWRAVSVLGPCRCKKPAAKRGHVAVETDACFQLASLTAERAVVMTTHSMEEVDALASRVGIIAAKMLGECVCVCVCSLAPLVGDGRVRASARPAQHNGPPLTPCHSCWNASIPQVALCDV
jgi:ABC-type nitrate/sulfonate/bicarbonate transport system ATPase subunit